VLGSHTVRTRSELPIVLSTLLLAGCGALATSPPWIGGGLAVTGPLRVESEEAVERADRAKIASQPQQIGARHVLVMHVASRAKPENMTRTRAEALERAKECLRKLRAGADFADLVGQYSDEPGANERGGDLGVFRRDSMVQSFSDAAFALKIGEVSEVVETPYGFHIIQRTQ
jgi:NIMA-interacting peptidyl-prolyl cis-trans isomerase 1